MVLREGALAMANQYGAAWQRRAWAGERPVIGDELRQVAAWCELGWCIARYVDSVALGFADLVARALAAGWCKDGFGRLICPACQQRFAIWSSAPVLPHARDVARNAGPATRYVGQHRPRGAGSRASRLGGGLRRTGPGETDDPS